VVAHTEVALGDLTRVVTCLSQDCHDLALQGLLKGLTRQGLKFSPLVGLYETVNPLLSLADNLVYPVEGLPRKILVVNGSGKALVGDDPDGELRDLVEELPGPVNAVLPDYDVEELSVLSSVSLLINGTAEELSVLDVNEA
jgi:hypothetical protein